MAKRKVDEILDCFSELPRNPDTKKTAREKPKCADNSVDGLNARFVPTSSNVTSPIYLNPYEARGSIANHKTQEDVVGAIDQYLLDDSSDQNNSSSQDSDQDEVTHSIEALLQAEEAFTRLLEQYQKDNDEILMQSSKSYEQVIKADKKNTSIITNLTVAELVEISRFIAPLMSEVYLPYTFIRWGHYLISHNVQEPVRSLSMRIFIDMCQPEAFSLREGKVMALMLQKEITAKNNYQLTAYELHMMNDLTNKMAVASYAITENTGRNGLDCKFKTTKDTVIQDVLWEAVECSEIGEIITQQDVQVWEKERKAEYINKLQQDLDKALFQTALDQILCPNISPELENILVENYDELCRLCYCDNEFVDWS